MNKLVLVLFVGVLIAILGIGIYYLKETSFAYLSQTKKISFPNPSYLLAPSTEKVAASALNNCKDTGFPTQDKATSYIESVMSKADFGQDSKKNVMSVVNIGKNCWGVWVGDDKGNGNLYYEDENGNLVKTKSKISLE
jgi:hypothetical protein